MQKRKRGKSERNAGPTRREALVAGAALVAGPFLGGATARAAQADNTKSATEWLSYGGDKASSKYSPLAQIARDNFSGLKAVWTWRSADEEIEKGNPSLKAWTWEATPLMVGGVLYVSPSLSQGAAIDAA